MMLFVDYIHLALGGTQTGSNRVLNAQISLFNFISNMSRARTYDQASW
jgi:hypothetical protein